MPSFNHLKNETSPYLKQHAENPVDWYPWGEEAFKIAEERGVPIFLSIGYSTCHWCHVMERESFVDQKVADLLNNHFVAVKVDREERPDIDQFYMDVCRMMTGGGGWPLSIFMTADKKPFFAATYIPKKDKFGRNGLLTLLPKINDLWHNQKNKLLSSSENIIQHLKNEENNINSEQKLSPKIIDESLNILSRIYDTEYGGFGNQPKFPMTHYIVFLLEQWQKKSKNKYLKMVEETLYSMRAGGIFDQLGGGFHRYSTDQKWELPHFEKMLYDQALLIYNYAEAYQITKKDIYLDTIDKTVSYLKREMRDQNGLFYSAEDADSEGVEGKFYLWDKKEIDNILTEKESDRFWQIFKSQKADKITLTLKNAEDFAEIADIRAKLFQERKKRVRPAKDKKILTDWNGLTAAALAKAGFLTGNKEYISMAEKAANFIFTELRDKAGNLIHSYHQEQASKVDNLADYSYLLWAFVELYQSTLKQEYLLKAKKITEQMIERFWDHNSAGFYFTAAENNELFLRQKKTEDSAIPSANSIAAYNILKLAHLLDDYDLREKVEKMLSSFSSAISYSPVSHLFMLITYNYLENPFKEINIYGSLKDQKVKKLLNYLKNNYKPELLLKYNDVEGKATEETRFSLCSDFVCGKKTTDINKIISSL